MEKVYLSKDGYDKMVADLEFLKTSKRREIAKQLDLARSFGDLRENAEYETAKQALALNEIRIRELEEKISRAEIIKPESIQTDKVFLGSKVTLWDLTYEEEVIFELTGSDEADPAEGRISINSPVATALLGHSVGETVEVKAPRGVQKYKILKISR
ncbi:MAG TPA: transcription elongation factor GreA [Chitinispirillaceae bacterium]|mgnify:CR=1 FL=1|nr:transcription elongation factor GreA [Chitinispirillaceae bacterium]